MARVSERLEDNKIAALHLDKVQDSGRYTTSESMKHFTGRFRNFMQNKSWPASVIITGTMEAKTIINQDETLRRRLKSIEVLPMTFSKEGPIIREAVKELLSKTGLEDDGLLDENEFIRILMHASAQRFGMTIEIFIAAMGAARLSKHRTISFEHFAEVYYERMNCDDALNPFISHKWKNIDTTVAMDRYLEETRRTQRRPAKK